MSGIHRAPRRIGTVRADRSEKKKIRQIGSCRGLVWIGLNPNGAAHLESMQWQVKIMYLSYPVLLHEGPFFCTAALLPEVSTPTLPVA